MFSFLSVGAHVWKEKVGASKNKENQSPPANTACIPSCLAHRRVCLFVILFVPTRSRSRDGVLRDTHKLVFILGEHVCTKLIPSLYLIFLFIARSASLAQTLLLAHMHVSHINLYRGGYFYFLIFLFYC